MQKSFFSLFLCAFNIQLRAILGEAICSYHARIGRDPKLQASVSLSLTSILFLCTINANGERTLGQLMESI